ncbi:hypothetical protein [Mucilaginibacter pedocola]|uniref:Uncharacterized protein n=1 Tax=Mucilaginibacter pedocola TaxID=1792845 RepID=A0A1S9PKW1_9SPHI|nr:hypothetical protein [Mucilaginibacter pedocola]OOQ61587.1 hypothetical protein BC343_00470 [Mucilaginibacter pedocola]
MDTHEWPCRIKSARQKRRLVKTDRDKQLIRLDKRRNELWEQRRHLPWVPLEHPYQRGWKRYFILREDVKRSPKAAFYETLLEKINTTEYHHDKSFKRKKRRKGRYGYYVKQQFLKEFSPYAWEINRMGLTEEEKACFTRIETYFPKTRRTEVVYRFKEAWRYVLKIAPNMITHVKPLDLDIERELAYIHLYLENRNLEPRLCKLKDGDYYRRIDWYDYHANYINNFKNLPGYTLKEAYLEINT